MILYLILLNIFQKKLELISVQTIRIFQGWFENQFVDCKIINTCQAIVHDAGIPEGIGAVSVLNSFYGRDDIPLGAYKGSFGREPNGGGWVRGAYVDDLVNNWYSPVKDSSQVLEFMIELLNQELNPKIYGFLSEMMNSFTRISDQGHLARDGSQILRVGG